MMINFLLASITEPHFMEDYSLVLIAVAGALAYLSARQAAAGRALGSAENPRRGTSFKFSSVAERPT